MGNVKSKDAVFLFALLGGLYTFIILANVGKGAGPAAWVGFVGSLLGAVITIVGAYVVFHLQTDATDARQLETVRALLAELSTAGEGMADKAAELDPVKYVREASIAYSTVLNVALEMRAKGPNIARVSERLRVAEEAAALERLVFAQGGIAAGDLYARGEEIKALGAEPLNTLKQGL